MDQLLDQGWAQPVALDAGPSTWYEYRQYVLRPPVRFLFILIARWPRRDLGLDQAYDGAIARDSLQA